MKSKLSCGGNSCWIKDCRHSFPLCSVQNALQHPVGSTQIASKRDQLHQSVLIGAVSVVVQRDHVPVAVRTPGQILRVQEVHAVAGRRAPDSAIQHHFGAVKHHRVPTGLHHLAGRAGEPLPLRHRGPEMLIRLIVGGDKVRLVVVASGLEPQRTHLALDVGVGQGGGSRSSVAPDCARTCSWRR